MYGGSDAGIMVHLSCAWWCAIHTYSLDRRSIQSEFLTLSKTHLSPLSIYSLLHTATLLTGQSRNSLSTNPTIMIKTVITQPVLLDAPFLLYPSTLPVRINHVCIQKHTKCSREQQLESELQILWLSPTQPKIPAIKMIHIEVRAIPKRILLGFKERKLIESSYRFPRLIQLAQHWNFEAQNANSSKSHTQQSFEHQQPCCNLKRGFLVLSKEDE